MRIDYENLLKLTKELIILSHDFFYCILPVPSSSLISLIKDFGTSQTKVIVLRDLMSTNVCYFKELSASSLFYIHDQLADFILITENFCVFTDVKIRTLQHFESCKEFEFLEHNAENHQFYNIVHYKAISLIDHSTLINSEYLETCRNELQLDNITKILNLL